MNDVPLKEFALDILKESSEAEKLLNELVQFGINDRLDFQNKRRFEEARERIKKISEQCREKCKF